MKSDPHGKQQTGNPEQRIDVGIEGKIILAVEQKAGSEEREKETPNPAEPPQKVACYRRLGRWMGNDPNAFTAMMATVIIAIFRAGVWRIAQQQTSDARAVQRAFVFPVGAKIITTGPKLVGKAEEVIAGAPSGIKIADALLEVQFENNGDTPARELRITGNSCLRDGYLPDDFSYPIKKDASVMVAPPKSHWGIRILTDAKKVAQFLPPASADVPMPIPKKLLFVWGIATYDDVFGDSHVSQFCYRYNGYFVEHGSGQISFTFEQCPRHNCTDKDCPTGWGNNPDSEHCQPLGE